jgi:hypothetical protein
MRRLFEHPYIALCEVPAVEHLWDISRQLIIAVRHDGDEEEFNVVASPLK